MPTLYVTEPGSRIEKEGHRILVSSKEDEVLLRVPLRQVSEVVLVGWVGATTPAMLALLDAGVNLTLITRSGRLRGRLQAPQARNLPLRRAQYARGMDPDFCLAVSQAVVSGKLTNYRIQAMRILRNLTPSKETGDLKLQTCLDHLTRMLAAVQAADNSEELRGLEGNGTRAYFAILRAGLKWTGGRSFQKRTRRPPKDPVNALLSFGYTLLTDAIFTAIEVVGLDPYAGFFHIDQYSRPALALDLVEEFRPLVVDSLVLTLVNKRLVKTKDFERGVDGGIYLTRRGLRIFFNQFVKRMNTRVHHPQAGRSISYQKCFEVQARQMRGFIEGKYENYKSFSTR
jgi:CRISPR-associated protein Cas1